MKEKFKGDVRDFQGESLTRKKYIFIMNERKKERKKRMRNMRKRKNMSMRKVSSPVL
jgi:hypothetical protein